MIVFGCSEDEHLDCLHIVFEHFREFNLKLKPSKCLFFQSEIVYMAHHISREGIHPSRDNVCTIEDFPVLETFTQVHAFCRLVGHYQCFIKGFAHIARPLYEVVRTLKGKIQSAPVLVFLDFNISFLLEMDASKEGLGAVLSQKQDDRCYHPIAFGSCSLTPA